MGRLSQIFGVGRSFLAYLEWLGVLLRAFSMGKARF